MSFDVHSEGRRLRSLEGVWADIPDPGRLVLSGGEVDRLAAVESRLRRSGRWVSGPSSLFQVLGVTFDEVRNCRVVRWLLDPLAPHGLGTEALGLFLADVATGVAADDTAAPVFDRHEDAVLVVEESRANSRADLVIHGPGWTVVVEAKIHAAEGTRQGARLALDWPDATLVFLTLGGAAMATAEESRWVGYSWGRLLAQVEQAAAAAPNPLGDGARRARNAVMDYLYATRRLRR